MLILLVIILAILVISALDRDQWPEPERRGRGRTQGTPFRTSRRRRSRRPASKGFLVSSGRRPYSAR